MEWIPGGDSNVFIRPNRLEKAGDKVEGHTHKFDHVTIVFTGEVAVYAKLPNGTVIEEGFAAPAHFLVRKNVEHTITAKVDHTEFWCVYAHRTPQGEHSELHTGWPDAYQ